MNDEYSRYAKKYNQRLRNGDLRSALGALREMAAIRRREGCDADEMKLLMLAFYISTSGCAGEPGIEAWIATAAQDNVSRNREHLWDVISGQAYLDTVRRDTTPSHIMSVQDSRYLFELVAVGLVDAANQAIRRFAVSAQR